MIPYVTSHRWQYVDDSTTAVDLISVNSGLSELGDTITLPNDGTMNTANTVVMHINFEAQNNNLHSPGGEDLNKLPY